LVLCLHAPSAIKVNEQGTSRQLRDASQALEAALPQDSAILEVEHRHLFSSRDDRRARWPVDQAIRPRQSQQG
jgi:thiamine phosphate synthase YjbQ (UPF0047 family)